MRNFLFRLASYGLASALLSGAPVMADTTMNGVAYSRVNADLRQEGRYEDNLELRNKLFLQMAGEPMDNVRLVFSALAEHNTFSGIDTRLQYEVNLYEAVARIRSGDFDFYFGQQIVDWAKADVSVVDNLNPRNLEEFVAREEEFLKIPVLMARMSWLGEYSAAELAYIPFYTPSNFRLYGSDWSMLDQNALGDYDGDIDVSLYTRQGFKPGIDDFPQANGINGTAAGRWMYQGDDFDYQVSYVNGWAVLPLFEFNKDFAQYLRQQPEGPQKVLETLTPQEVLAFAPLYESRPVRQNQLGFGTSGFLGESTVRAEVAAIHPQELYTTDFVLSEHTVAAAAAGIDRFLPGNVYLNLSYLGAYIGDYPDEGLFLMREWNHFGVGLLRASFFGGDLAPEFRAIVNLGVRDYMLNPRIPVRVADNTTLTAGIYLLNGPRNSIFGQFRDNSFGFLQLRYAF